MKSFFHKYWLPTLIIFVLVTGISIGATALLLSREDNHSEASDNTTETEGNEEEATNPEPEVPPVPSFINLQSTVDTWLSSLPSNADVGLMVYDLDNEQVAAAYQPNKVFNAASIYKLFFVYDGYRQIASGTESADEFFVRASDYDQFHSGAALSFGDCLDLMIRESYNTCADPMRSDSARFARAEALAAELGLQNTSSAGLYSSAADLTELLKLYYSHPDLSEELWAKIQDSMLNQPKTVYNWRQGLPTGFTNPSVKVYDKVGWNRVDGSYWDPYDDAAIVEFTEQNRHYIVVVMTRFLPNVAPLINLGQAIEATILGAVVL